jgi:hypothetical protein
MQGWGSSDPLFEEIIRAIKPKIIVEVGSWKGASAINMAKIVKSLGLDCKIICVDTWLGSPEHFLGQQPSWRASLRLSHGYPQLYFTFLANVVRQGVDDVIIPIAATSESGAVILASKGVRPDMVYIDAAHEYEPALRDLRSTGRFWLMTAYCLAMTTSVGQGSRERPTSLLAKRGPQSSASQENLSCRRESPSTYGLR